MTIAESHTITAARLWIAALAQVQSPDKATITVRFAIFAVTAWPLPVYMLMTSEEPGTDREAGLEEFWTLEAAIEAMKTTVRCRTHHHYSFVFNFHECE